MKVLDEIIENCNNVENRTFIVTDAFNVALLTNLFVFLICILRKSSLVPRPLYSFSWDPIRSWEEGGGREEIMESRSVPEPI